MRLEREKIVNHWSDMPIYFARYVKLVSSTVIIIEGSANLSARQLLKYCEELTSSVSVIIKYSLLYIHCAALLLLERSSRRKKKILFLSTSMFS